MIKTIEQLEQELDAKIPRAVVSERDGGNGRRLSYLEGHYVIDRLNKVFGHLNWGKEILDVKEVVNKTTRGEFPAYLVRVKLTVQVPLNDGSGLFKFIVKEGYGYGSDKSPQNAHELAIKEAVTDGLKVAAKDLGMSLGLALYDRTQENVQDEPEKEVNNDVKTRPQSDSKEISKNNPKPSPVTSVVTGTTESKGPDQGNTKTDTGKLEEAVRSYVRVLDKQKRMSVDTFKNYLKGYFNVEKVVELNEEQLRVVYEFLKEKVK